MSDFTPDTQDFTAPAPQGWEVTDTGMRSLDGAHVVDGLWVGSDRRGEELLVAAGDGPATVERVTDDLHAQIDAIAKRSQVSGIDPAALSRLAADLDADMRDRSEVAREVFYGKVSGGDLYELLAGADGGIGPRHPHNVADVMRQGPRQRPMLVDGWLVADELHWIAAEPGAGKTWFGLWLAKRVIEDGGTVLWMDEEVGTDTVAERLLALGADPDLIEDRFVYFPYPDWLMDPEDVLRWEALVRAVRPALTVIDTATDALAEAGVDENSGVEVTGWVKAFCEPPRRVGSAVLVFDHIVKAGSGSARGYAVGSRAKKAKAKVQLELAQKEDYDSETLGLVEVTRTKLGINGRVPKQRSFRVGGDGAGHFLIAEVESSPAKLDAAASKADKQKRLRDRIEAVVREQGPINASQVKGQVTGKAQAITDALAELAESDLSRVCGRKDGRSTVYEWRG